MLDKTAFQSLLTPPIWQQVFPAPRIGLPKLGSGPVGAPAPGTPTELPHGPNPFDRVKETTTDTGIGPITLLGASDPSFFTFGSRLLNGDRCHYEIWLASTLCETGLGTYTTATNSLSRDVVLSSSNGDAIVSLPVGVKTVFITMPAALLSGLTDNVMLFGAKGDGQIVPTNPTGGSMLAGSPILTCPGMAVFTAADIRKLVIVYQDQADDGYVGPGPNAAVLASSIAEYISPSQVKLATAATISVSHCRVVWASDDTAAIQAAFDAAKISGGDVRFPPGKYGISASLVMRSTTDKFAYQSVGLIGSGSGHYNPASQNPAYDPSTQLLYMSATPGPMLQTGDPPFVQNGAYPIGDLRVRDMALDGCFLATFGLQLDRAQGCHIQNVGVRELEPTGKVPHASKTSAVANPSDTPTVNTTGGGTTGGGMAQGNYRISYGLQDLSGETLPSPESADFNIPALTAPVAGPTVVASGSGGTLPTGTYLCAYSYANASGETVVSPDTSVAVILGQNIVFTLPANPTGVTGKNCYTSDTNGATTTKKMQNVGGPVSGTNFTQTQDYPAGQPYPSATAAGDGRIPRVTIAAHSDLGYPRFYLTPPNGNTLQGLRYPVTPVTATTFDLSAVNTIGNGVGVITQVGGGLVNAALHLHACNDGRSNSASMQNLVQLFQGSVIPSLLRLTGDKAAGSNPCHNVFERMDCNFYGPGAYYLESCDNSNFLGSYLFRQRGAGPAVMVFPLARSCNFWHLEAFGGMFCDSPYVAAASNLVIGYDRGNGEPAPTLFAAATTAPTLALVAGGTLALVNTFYVVEALNATGLRIAQSAESTILPTSGNQTVRLSSYAVSGATSYKIWRGTATGAENTYFFTTAATYDDTGAAGNTGVTIDVTANANLTYTEMGVNTQRMRMGLLGLTTAQPTATQSGFNLPSGGTPTSPVAGDLWNESAQKTLTAFFNAVKQRIVMCLFTSTTAVSSTTTAETKSLIGSGIGTMTLGTNFMVVGKKLRLSGHGNITTGGTASTIDFQYFFAGTKIASTGALAPTISQANRYFEWELDILCVTVGGTGTFFCQGRVLIMNAAAPAAPTVWPILGNNATPPAAVTVDTTAASLVDFKTVTGNNLHTITNNPGTSLEVMN